MKRREVISAMQLREILGRRDGARKVWNFLSLAALMMLALLAIVPLALVFGHTLRLGLPALSLDFFTQLPAPVGEMGGGMGNAFLGTLTLLALAAAIGVPFGIAMGVFHSEYAHLKLARVTRFCVDLLTSLPSILIGLFTYALFVMPMKRFSALAGGFALSLVMLPVVARSSEEILKLVPAHVREAGLALGIPRWKVILRILLPGQLRGLTTGVMLAVARAAGETAPLLFTALNSQFWSTGLDQPISSLPVQIYTYATSPFEEWQRLAWSGALVLIVFVFVLNMLTRLLLRRKV
jgi:phosphate transport system permease protein